MANVIGRVLNRDLKPWISGGMTVLAVVGLASGQLLLAAILVGFAAILAPGVMVRTLGLILVGGLALGALGLIIVVPIMVVRALVPGIPEEPGAGDAVWLLVVGALGVVFGRRALRHFGWIGRVKAEPPGLPWPPVMSLTWTQPFTVPVPLPTGDERSQPVGALAELMQRIEKKTGVPGELVEALVHGGVRDDEAFADKDRLLKLLGPLHQNGMDVVLEERDEEPGRYAILVQVTMSGQPCEVRVGEEFVGSAEYRALYAACGA